MSKRGRQNFDAFDETQLDFSIEEIIAEVKGQNKPETHEKAADREKNAGSDKNAAAGMTTPKTDAAEDIKRAVSREVRSIPEGKHENEKPLEEVKKLENDAENRQFENWDESFTEIPEEYEEPGVFARFSERMKNAPRNFDAKWPDEPAKAAVNAGRKARSFAARSVIAFVIGIFMCYMTFADAYGLWMPDVIKYTVSPYIHLAILIACSIVCMFLALDIVSIGVYRLFILRPTMESLVAVCATAAVLHAASIIAFPTWGGYQTYTQVACLAIASSLWSKKQSMSALRKEYKTAAISDRPRAVLCDRFEKRKIRAITRENGFIEQFCLGLRDANVTDKYSDIYAAIAIVACIVFAAVSSVGTKRPQHFFLCFAMLTSVAAPFGLIQAYSMPFTKAVRKLFKAGVAIGAGRSDKLFKNMCEAVVRDEDLFPVGTVSINGAKIVGDIAYERVLSYATSAMREAKIGLYTAFKDQMEKEFIKPSPVSSVKHYDDGGIAAEICGDHVLIGTPGFLMRRGVRIKEGLNLKNGVFVAINMQVAGIFAVKYNVIEQISWALSALKRHKVTPVLAMRDFNLTPGMVENRFKLKPETTEYPGVEKRIEFSEETYGEGMEICAIVTRDGMAPIAESIVGSKKLFGAVKFNTWVGILSGAIGILLMFFLSYNFEMAAACPQNVLTFLILWAIPMWISSIGVKNY